MGDERTRRRFLELAGVGAGLPLAGCVAGSGSEAPTDADPKTVTAPRRLRLHRDAVSAALFSGPFERFRHRGCAPRRTVTRSTDPATTGG